MLRSRQAALALALAGLSGGCGGDGANDRVESYVKRANAIQRQSAPALGRANAVYARISTGKVAPVKARLDVEHAEDVLRATRVKLAGLAAPGEAAKLRQTLLSAYDANITFAEQTALLTRYLPAASAAVRPLDRAGARLRELLSTGDKPAEQAAALRTYATTVADVVGALRALVAPRLLFVSHQAQLRRLTRIRDLAWRLRHAVLTADAPRIQRLIESFQEAGAPQREGSALLNRSIRAYQRRQQDVDRAVAAVREEQARLQRALQAD